MMRIFYYALSLLTLINLLNYIDRWLISVVIPRMKEDLNMINIVVGFVMSVFMLGYFITSFFFGYLADRYSRIKLIVVGTTLWSLVMVLSGLGKTLFQIFFIRTAVGIGEASIVSSGQALIADFFPPRKRNQAMAFFTAVIPVGSAFGFILGGVFEHRFGWRTTFFLASIPGLLMVGLISFLKDLPRGVFDSLPQEKNSEIFKTDLKILFKNKLYLNTVWGYIAYTFTLGGFASWVAQYLVSQRGLPLAEADTTFGIITVITGTVGSLLGGYGAALYLKKRHRGDLWFVILTTALAIPFSFLGFLFKSKIAFLSCMAVAEFFLFLGQPAVNVVILESVAPRLRGIAIVLCIFLIHLLGDFISPSLVGILADHFSLERVVLLLPAMLFLAVFFYWRCFREAVNR